VNTTLALVLVLFVKHFVVDFLLQRPYQYSNKGVYGHPGGVLHAGLHGTATMLCLRLFGYDVELVMILGLLDTVLHYHIDWAKVNINRHYGWTATTHEEFWWLMGLDQFLHTATYILIIGLLA
jgi:Protein of unknown function (DUF3307)